MVKLVAQRDQRVIADCNGNATHEARAVRPSEIDRALTNHAFLVVFSRWRSLHEAAASRSPCGSGIRTARVAHTSLNSGRLCARRTGT